MTGTRATRGATATPGAAAIRGPGATRGAAHIPGRRATHGAGVTPGAVRSPGGVCHPLRLLLQSRHRSLPGYRTNSGECDALPARLTHRQVGRVRFLTSVNACRPAFAASYAGEGT